MAFQNFRIFILSGLAVAALNACSPAAIQHSENEGSINQSDNILNLLDPSIQTEDQAFAKAEAILAQGQTENALFYYIKTLQYNPKNIKALEHIAEIHSRSKHPELALKVYKDILAIDSQHVLANEYVGLHLLENGRNGKAEEHLNIVVKNTGNSWKAHNGLGIIADLKHNTEQAISNYEAALAIEPSSPMLLNNLGYSYYLAGNEIKAKTLFNQALNFDNKYKRAIHNLALIHIKSGSFMNAAALFNRIMPVHDSFNNIGYIAMLNGQYDAAEEYLNRAVDECPVYFPKAQENLKTLAQMKTSAQPYPISAADEAPETRAAPEIQPPAAQKPSGDSAKTKLVVPKIVKLDAPVQASNVNANKAENAKASKPQQAAGEPAKKIQEKLKAPDQPLMPFSTVGSAKKSGPFVTDMAPGK